jgi:dipeptidyl aminopeptidase/acylaminoacyl peptidase
VGVWEREREGKSGLLYVDGEGGVFEYDVETDFVTSPQVSSDGRRLVWLGWNDPYMPWDRNSVWIADREEGGGWVGMRELLAEEEESCYFLPRWDGEGHLYVMKETGEDEGGYWNLHRVYEEEGAVEGAVENVLPLQAECGLPQWQSGMSTYDFCGKDEVVVAYTHGGRWHLGRGDLQKGEVVETCEGEWSAFEGIVCGDGFVVFLGVHVNGDREVVKMATRGMRVESRSMDVRGEREEVWYDVFSVGEEEEKGVMVYYPPRGFSEGDEAPPVIVRVHGGPTAQVVGEADVRTAYWTSRGVGVCDVNYRGSSGFGRSYRRKLEGGWGCVEVEDIRSAARRLVEKGYGDGERMVVYGTSAGGLSVLMSLIEGDEFCGGICLYGVTDLRDLLTSTHRFEAYYVESLVGKREDEEKYRSRSPLYRGGEVRKPVLFFHGREDMVVPCSQTEEMVGVIRAKGGDAELVIFEGEGHGFRKRETVMACMEAQEKFLRRVFGYEGETWA